MSNSGLNAAKAKKYEASGIMVEAKHHKFTFTY